MAFFLVPLCLAAPVKRGLLDEVMGTINNLPLENVTLAGIMRLVTDSMSNPGLARARIAVIRGEQAVRASLPPLGSQANATGNSGVADLVAKAQEGFGQAHQAINRIGESIISGSRPLPTDQADAARGMKILRDAVKKMDTAITTPDRMLKTAIANATSATDSLIAAGRRVLSNNNVTLDDLGLPHDFDP